MTKAEYMARADGDPDVIELTQEDIREWLDRIIDALVAARDNTYGLYWGKLDLKKGEYENSIRPCHTGSEYCSLHIFEGIEKLAAAFGMRLSVTERYSNGNYYEYWFHYRSVRVFQLENEALEGV